ncbi:hypothetical protein CK203_028029 [Vitis vinifera]|uniref:Uncharacterized protein n=1 Tax=Vitis vinifera TaxID=29760 RepID=A0A438ILN5_VITVI|nr:hypothetical protein CK203_028029 [Vitis vinifera]
MPGGGQTDFRCYSDSKAIGSAEELKCKSTLSSLQICNISLFVIPKTEASTGETSKRLPLREVGEPCGVGLWNTIRRGWRDFWLRTAISIGIVDHKRVDRSRVTNHHNRDSLWCTYSQKATHTQEQRWKLHGEPSTSNHDKGQAHLYFIQPIKERSLEQGGFNQEEIEKLQTLLGSFEKLLDSDGTDHITHSSRKFNNYNPCPNNRKIVIDDGSLTTIIGKNSIKEDKDEDKDFGSFLIDLSKVTDPIFVPSFSKPESFVSSLKSIIEQTGKTMVAPKDRIIGLKEENCSL